jgi:S1-C subfamily serine protease
MTSPLAEYSDTIADIVATLGRSTLALRSRTPLASAVLWRDGVVVTVAHPHRRIPSTLTLDGAGGTPHEAALAGADVSTDLAVYRVAEAAGTPLAAMADPAAIRAGQVAIAAARLPGGDLAADHGLVQRVSGPWQSWLGGTLDSLIRLDGSLQRGFSGAAVADARGAVLGLATAALSRSHGIVIPAATVNRVVDALLAKGHVERGFLGIGAQPVRLDGGGGESGAGLLVNALAADGPAAKSGVLVGDIIVAAGGAAVASLRALRAALADRVGQTVTLRLSRGGQPQEVDVPVAAWPERAHCR